MFDKRRVTRDERESVLDERRVTRDERESVSDERREIKDESVSLFAERRASRDESNSVFDERRETKDESVSEFGEMEFDELEVSMGTLGGGSGAGSSETARISLMDSFVGSQVTVISVKRSRS